MNGRLNMKNLMSSLKDKRNIKVDFVPNSATYTKLELPILYSNLVLIEDMKFENSNYFLRSNGFTSTKIKLSSLTYDSNFDISSCVFRIYPRTYNINKCEVIKQIKMLNENKECKNKDDQIHFKFSAEMFNNLDIVQNKFAEPVRYGDIIMLMHENSKMFIKFNPNNNTLSLSNHDQEATLFSVEPASEIMLNDNQILKTGQPVKFKIAWFNYANDNLYIGTRISVNAEREENNINLRKTVKNERRGSTTKLFNRSSENTYDKEKKKYICEPDVVIEENSSMKWRINLYSPFTSNENLIIYGDFFQIYHCLSNSFLCIGNITEINNSDEAENKLSKNRESIIDTRNENDFSLDLDDSGADLLNENSFSEIDNDLLIKESETKIDAEFFLKKEQTNSEFFEVNSTWIIESIFPLMKKQSFVRFMENNKLDTYRMAFRIKNFKTNKVLSVKPIEDAGFLKALQSDYILYRQGILKGGGDNEGKIYKFTLVDDNKGLNEDEINTEEYQYSLFGFKKYIKSNTYYSQRPECNDFLRIYHISTGCYLKVIPTDKGKSKNVLGNIENIAGCTLTLSKFPEESEVFKICPIDPFSHWKFKFLSSLYSLFQNVTNEIDKGGKDLKNNLMNLEKIQMTSFILDKLLKFTLNKFINKFSTECGYNTVVKSRQILISKFDFSFAFYHRFIYNFWIDKDPELTRLIRLNNMLTQFTNSLDAFNNINSRSPDEKMIIMMYKYTEAIFG
ncbi:MAG: hypothetical protein MJ252_01970, partial [archaeon]|nr:hypothetical protein [archaeon]